MNVYILFSDAKVVIFRDLFYYLSYKGFTRLFSYICSCKSNTEQGMDGKRVFVTGGAKGIGAAIVTAFCNMGARVAFCDSDEKAAQHLCDLLPAFVQFFKDRKSVV